MFKSQCCITLACLLSFNAYAEPTENQMYPYNQQVSVAQDQPYPYSPLPVQVYPNSQQPQDYYPYGPKSSQMYVYNQSSVPETAGCSCKNKHRSY